MGKLSGEGSYWFGKSISLVDLTFYPWFERWSAIAHYRGFELPSELTRLQRWREAVSQRESVQAIANSTEYYIQRSARFAAPIAKKVSDELSVAGKLTPEQLQQAAQQGFKSVLNLRSPDEPGFLSDEQQQAQAAGVAIAGVILVILLGSACFSIFSLIVGCLVKSRERFGGLGQLMSMPLFFASNAIYPISLMPPWLQVLSHLNPLTYQVDGLRGVMLANSATTYGFGWDCAILLFVVTVLTVICARLYPQL